MAISQLYPTQRPALDLNFARQKRLDSRVTFTRGSTATYVGSDGLIKTAASGEARFDHDPVTGESLGLLVEESRTNSFLYSESFNVYWDTSGTIQPNASSAPDNTSSATLVTPLSGTFFVRKAPSGTGTATSSVFVKDAGAGSCAVAMGSSSAGYLINVNLVTGEFISGRSYGGGTLVGYTIQPVSGGWYRISVAATASSRGINILRADGTTPTQGIYVWGAVLELGALFPTSYIPTTSSTVTRSADVASMTGTNFSSWYNQSEGSFSLTAPTLKRTSANQRVVSTTSSSPTEGVQFWNSSGTATRYRIYKAGSLEVNISTSTYEGANWGWVYKTNDAALFKNGALLASDTSCAMPTAATSLSIGNNGLKHISRLIYWPYRLTDAQLEALTL